MLKFVSAPARCDPPGADQQKGVDMSKVSGIYRIELGNGWFYIGSAVDLRRRKREHLRTLNSQIHFNSRMQNIWNKYGVFEFTILEEYATNELVIREQIYLDKHFDDPKNVNLAPTAGSCLGRVHSVKTRAKMSASRKGKVFSAETREKISLACKGRKGHSPSIEHRRKISAASTGRVASVETRAKMSAAWIRRRAA